jgi:hypothetical protein
MTEDQIEKVWESIEWQKISPRIHENPEEFNKKLRHEFARVLLSASKPAVAQKEDIPTMKSAVELANDRGYLDAREGKELSEGGYMTPALQREYRLGYGKYIWEKGTVAETLFADHVGEEDGDFVLIERGLLGAACSAIDKKRDAPKVLNKLRAITCAPAAPAQSGDTALLARAIERMDRARNILTDGNPRPECNWGMLDTSDLKAARPAQTERALTDFFDVVFDGPPGHESGRFVECEDSNGKSFNAGEWIDRGNGLWALRIKK